MSQNALLRSVKGLGIPGTARKEDRKTKLKVATPAPAPEDDRQQSVCKDHFATRNGVRCAGVHLIVDLHGAKRLNDIEHIEATLRRCVEAASATLLHIHLHHFQPSGVSGVAVLAESHISIHTWPEIGYAALDVFMCGSADPDAPLVIDANYFSSDVDRRHSIDMVRLVRRIMSQAALKPYLVAETVPGPAVQSDDEILEAFFQSGNTAYHVAGTCRMGADEASVVDPELRVRGVQGLRVADTSVMPSLVSGNTNGPAMAMALRASEIILGDRVTSLAAAA